ncbi:MAG: ATP-binding protein [Candidatus Caldarchaeum sp.]|nr:ATP-binding protein [Candidatus Caldarchaeum sp.]
MVTGVLPAKYFTPGPKTNKRELFDREKELSELIDALKGDDKLVLVTGIRRMGKTSLIKVALNESNIPNIYIDLRKADSYEDAALLSLLSDGLNSLLPAHSRLIEYLGSLRGVSVGEVAVSFNLRTQKPSITRLLDKLDEWADSEKHPVVIALDEAQELRFYKGRYDFPKIIAYSFDNHRWVKFLVSGSEVGLLYSTLGFDDAKSPLYGRHRRVIQLERFPLDLAKRFLREGFMQEGVLVEDWVVDKACEAFDGIVGWLAFYGYEVVNRVKAGRQVGAEILDEILNEAVEMMKQELESVRRLSEFYIVVLRILSKEEKTWSDIKKELILSTGRSIANSQLSRILRNLEKLSYVGRSNGNYRLLDNLVGLAASRMRNVSTR